MADIDEVETNQILLVSIHTNRRGLFAVTNISEHINTPYIEMLKDVVNAG